MIMSPHLFPSILHLQSPAAHNLFLYFPSLPYSPFLPIYLYFFFLFSYVLFLFLKILYYLPSLSHPSPSTSPIHLSCPFTSISLLSSYIFLLFHNSVLFSLFPLFSSSTFFLKFLLHSFYPTLSPFPLPSSSSHSTLLSPPSPIIFLILHFSSFVLLLRSSCPSASTFELSTSSFLSSSSSFSNFISPPLLARKEKLRKTAQHRQYSVCCCREHISGLFRGIFFKPLFCFEKKSALYFFCDKKCAFPDLKI